MTPAKMVLPKKNKENDRIHRKNEKPSTSSRLRSTSSKTKVPIRVGRDYQAACPELVPENEREPHFLADRALLVWSPNETIADRKLEDYLAMAEGKYSYGREQSLGMLFWHRHNLAKAMVDLANFEPAPNEWSEEERALFEQAFQLYGKDFHRICKMLPGKSIASLVQYYYSWKKTRHGSLNKQRKKLKACKKGRAHTEGSSENN